MDNESTGNTKLSRPQQLLTGLASDSTAARMEAESRKWMIHCQKCGYERSVWEAGGVRYKGTGTSWLYRRCPNCGKWSWNKVYKPADAPATDPMASSYSLPPLVTGAATNRPPRLLLWTMVIGVPLLLIALFVFALIAFIGNLTQPVVNAGDAFMTALKASDYSQAYALCTTDLQNELNGVAGLSTLVQDNRPASWSWSSRSIRNGVGELDGSLTYANGKAGTVQLTLTQVGNDWKIVGFRMNPT